jgi:hypothetical protein
MLPLPGRDQKASKPLAWSCDANCQVSHSSESTTSGRPKRLTKRRTSVTIEPASRASSTAAPEQRGQRRAEQTVAASTGRRRAALSDLCSVAHDDELEGGPADQLHDVEQHRQSARRLLP